MLDVILALVPAFAVACWFSGWDAVRLVTVCTLACVVTEHVCRKAMGRETDIGDLSAVVTGILLAFNLPPTLPTWIAVVGSVFAIAIAKQVFGGIGYNPFNPALAARVMLLVSFPARMTSWSAMRIPQGGIDAITHATPLGIVKTAVGAGAPIPFDFTPDMAVRFLIGDMNGCIGEVSAAALLLGAVYLLLRRCISLYTPVFYIGTVAIIAAILWAINPEANLPPHFHLLAGGLMLGALYMATDMVTSPITAKGMAIFGVGCGVLTMVIRKWGGYPEGVSFAILLMNSVTPLINRMTRPRVFGAPTK
jgi:electron transport complex protein RnfD